jgi:curli production assembly/transport component CsgG
MSIALFKTLAPLAGAALLLSGCMTPGAAHDPLSHDLLAEAAHVTDRTPAGEVLAGLPEPSEKVAVVVYDFGDQTGQFKSSNTNAIDYSSAVTKGGYAILVNAMLEAGDKTWFTVVERGGLKDLLQERQIINNTRLQYKTKDGGNLAPLPPLLYGGMLIEGGIISYDSNVLTGGAGAAYLGISNSLQYHRDLVSVYLRAVNVQTGEVLESVTGSKTVYSVLLDSNLIKYVGVNHLLQVEAGVSANESTHLAVRQAIETALYSLIMEGANDGLWSFKDPKAGQVAMAEYLKRKRQFQ